ncbi:MAG: RNA polymerase sigma factor [Planctomycetes bacterium]|nr:RNA polymerase sigma factor [Planctomycetota bacterium]
MEKTKAGVQAQSDAELIRAIASRRDREAFGELYRRYERQAYSLARYMLRETDLAEDAVQEAMLRIWRAAERFTHDANPRGWVMRIVAVEALRKLKGKRQLQSRTEALDADAASGQPAPPETSEQAQGEALAALRLGIERLPESGRRVVTLYYLGGLTQQEIAQEMALTQQTVSHHLHEALKRLRAEFSRAGLAAALPLLADDALGGALGESFHAPASLGAHVFDALGRSGGSGAAVSRALSRKAAAAKPSAIGVTVAVVAVAAAGAGYFAMGKQPAPAQPAAAPLRTNSWDFTRGTPPGFKILKGAWTVQVPKEDKLPGGMYAHKEEAIIAALPVEVLSRPFVVQTDIFFSLELGKIVPNEEGGRSNLQCGVSYGYTEGDGDAGMQAWLQKPSGMRWDAPGAQAFRADHYFIGRYIFHLFEGQVISVKVNEAPYTTGQVYLLAFGCGIHRIDYRELREDEIPAVLRDPDAVVAKIRKEMVAGHGGWFDSTKQNPSKP